MATAVLILLVVLSFAAAAFLFAVIGAWRRIEPFYIDTWSKGALETAQVIAGVAALGGAYASTADKTEWLPASIAGAVCVALCKASQIIADGKAKRSQGALAGQIRELEAEVIRAKEEGIYRTRLLTTLWLPVVEKRRRVEKEIAHLALGQEVASIKHARRALRPKEHLDGILVDLTTFFLEEVPAHDRPHHQFRVGLYIDERGTMRPVHGVSSKDPGYNPFTSHSKHEEFFRLDATSYKSHTVRCVQQKTMLIVPDCAEAMKRGDLVFFNPRQPTYLKSMLACYIGDVCGVDSIARPAALVIDTDAAGFFRTDNFHSLKFVIEQFSARLLLELSFLALVTTRTKKGKKAPP
jgi:hypothetical protein